MRKSTKLKIFRRKKRSVILSVLKRHSLRQHTQRLRGSAGGKRKRAGVADGTMNVRDVVPRSVIW